MIYIYVYVIDKNGMDKFAVSMFLTSQSSKCFKILNINVDGQIV